MRAVVAEDVMLTRTGIVRLLTDAGLDVVAECADADGLLRAVRVHAPDVVVTDIRMPPTQSDEGLVAAERIRREHPGTAVLLLSHHLEAEYALRLVEDFPGGIGYLLKDRLLDAAVLVDALHRLRAEECVVDPTIVARLMRRRRQADPLEHLTPREREVLGLIAEGRSNEGIAEHLTLSLRTVESHATAAFGKLEIPSSAADNRRVLAVLAYLRAAR